MKLGILTQPLYNNYGGILQNFALQTMLKRLGYEVETINFVQKPLDLSLWQLWMAIIKNIVRKLMGRRVLYFNPNTIKKKVYTSTPEKQRFIDKYIRKVDVFPPLTKVWAENQSYDGYVVGSDQIWRPLYSPSISNFFLDFTEDLDVKRVAYAASFGVSNWELSSEQTMCATVCLKSFNGISVREKAAVAMCSEHLGVSVLHVIDPTMLLSAQDYHDVIQNSETSAKDDNYILCYTLDKNQQVKRVVDSISRKLNTKVYFVSGENIGGEDIGIEKWLCLIANAKYVITDSFHGTVFSILFHRPFATLINGERGAERINSLLAMFGLEMNMIDTVSKNCTVNYQNNWENVEELLSQYRKEAIEFLRNSLD